jgi:hypothetical protein
MKIISLTFLLLFSFPVQADFLGISNPADIAGQQGASVFSAGHYFAGSDYIAVNQFSNDWNGAYSPRNGANLAILNARIEAGTIYNSWRLVTLYRKEIIIESGRDITNIVYYNKQHLSVPAGQSFNIDLRVEGFDADGIRLDKGFVLPRINEVALSAGAGISLLRGKSARIGRVDGTASSTLAGYVYDATIEDSNSKASYPFIRDATPSGQGYALDVGLKAAWPNGSLLEVAANDLLGEMRWDNMPYTIETANSATLARDPSGYIYYNPTVTGWNDLNRRSFTHKLNPKVNAQFTYPLGTWEASAGTDWMKGYWFPQLGMTYQLNETWQTSLDYDVRFNSLGLGIKHKLFYLNLRSESASLGTARAYGLAGGVKVSF